MGIRRLSFLLLTILAIVSPRLAFCADEAAAMDQCRTTSAQELWADAMTACNQVLEASPFHLEALRLMAQAQEGQHLHPAAIQSWLAAARHGGGLQDYLRAARAGRNAFQLEQTLAIYEEMITVFPTAEAYRSWAETLLAFSLYDQAGRVLEQGLRSFPVDPQILELRAVLAAQRGNDEESVRWLRKSWAAGADGLSWAENTLFGERVFQPPYSGLLSAARLASNLSALPEDRQAVRLRLIGSAMRTEAAGPIADLLLSGAPASIQRLGLADLALLKDGALPYLSGLLQSPDPALRRKVLATLWDLRLGASLAALEEFASHEGDLRNAALAEVLIATQRSREAKNAAALEAVAADNPFHFLVLSVLEELYRSWGQTEQARRAHERLQAIPLSPPAPENAASGVPAYWECMERKDIRDMLDLLESHRNVRRVDARLYGLPENDFDDGQNLTISERLFLRSWAKENGLDWPVEGQLQYPREIRHTLKKIYAETGLAPDCSGLLAAADGSDERTLQRDGNEANASSDTAVEDEANIVVNPYNQAFVVATSNPSASSGNKWYRSSNYGKSFATTGTIGSESSCDPVSYYNTGGVLFHSFLSGCASLCQIRASYSTDNGSTWNTCANTVDTDTTNDREDLYIDTFNNSGGAAGWSASPCLNRAYIGYGKSNAQTTRSSVTGTSAPYCGGTWTSVTLASPGNGATIGVGITSAIGKTSGNGTVIYTFSRFGSSTSDALAGIYYALSTDCGTSYSTPARISTINTVGDFEWPIPSTCSRQTYIYVQTDSDRQPLSAFRNNVYVAWNDLSSACTPPGCSGNTTCNSDIFVARGVPNNRDNPTAWTWTTINLTSAIVGTDAYTDEFYPSISVDQANGDVLVSYYRSDSGSVSLTARQKQVHYVTVRSIDGGSTWQPAYQVTQLPTNEYDGGADTGMQWGDYTWLDVINGVAYPVWTDRRDNNDEEIYASKVCSEPTHWAERGLSPSAPATTTATGAAREIAVSWTAPDLYWGDGGENNASRKYQLWVDGSLAQDNILWTSTSASYTASDCSTPHIFRVRAVNQCGVYKEYAPSTLTATGCCANNPTGINVTPSGPLTLCQGTSQLLTAGLTGGVPPYAYQWQRDGASIPGATTSTYTASDTGTKRYNCVVKGSGCADGSADSSPTQIIWQDRPIFAGLQSISNPEQSTCTLSLSWSAASTVCPGGATYSIYRSTTPGFTPGPANQIASGATGTSYTDLDQLVSGTTYYYVVRAVAVDTGVEETNTAERSGKPTGPVTTSNIVETFEAAGGFDNAGWTHQAVAGSVDWIWSTAGNPHDGTRTWFSASQGSAADRVIVTPTFGVLSNTTLEFWHTYAFESATTCYDGGTLEISTDGGSIWSVIPGAAFTAGAYTGTVSASSNPINGKAAWCGGTIGAMTRVAVNLSGYSGQNVKVRWHAGEDSSSVVTGWYIDSITIMNAGTASACAAGSNCANNPSQLSVTPNGPLTLCAGTAQLLTATPTGGVGTTYQWYDGLNPISGATFSTYSANATGTHNYNCQAKGTGCSSAMSDASPTQITWQAEPTFAGLTSVTNPGQATCRLDLAWSAGSTPCTGGVTYNVYRSTTPAFTPAPANRIAAGVSAITYQDSNGLASGTTYYYKTRAVTVANGTEETNVVERSGAPFGPGGGNQTYINEPFTTGDPPTGWTRVNGGTGTQQWTTANPGARSIPAGMTAPIEIIDGDLDGTGKTQDDSLISPAFNCAGASSVTLEFDTYYNDYDGADFAYIDVSSNNGSTWTTHTTWTADVGSSATASHQTIDITTLAGTASQVKVRFHYVGTWGYYWLVDNVKVSGFVTNACTTGSAAPPPVKDTGANAVRFTKGAGNILNVTYDATSCSADKIIILYNTIGTWDYYAGCIQDNGGNGGSTTIDSLDQTYSWYNLIWAQGTTAGHPGYSFDGTTYSTRTWNVGTHCGMEADDKSRTTCP